MAGAERPRKRDRVKRYVAVPLALRTSDLPVRAGSAVVMLLATGSALVLGGWWWAGFVILVALGVQFEWNQLVRLFNPPGVGRSSWIVGGAIYCGVAAVVLISLRAMPLGLFYMLLILSAVIATDIGAYFAGRAIGGPKIAPTISPSKTWAGLAGGMAASAAAIAAMTSLLTHSDLLSFLLRDSAVESGAYASQTLPQGGFIAAVLAGAAIAVTAQAGDFFESWMKRRARVKDSGKLIPGHGGLFDRVDGLISVLFLIGVAYVLTRLVSIS